MKVKKLVVMEIEVDSADLPAVVEAPDGYRGDMSCLRVNTEAGYSHGKYVEPPTSGHQAYEVISPEGEAVGVVENWYGNGGQGKNAADRFYPKVSARAAAAALGSARSEAKAAAARINGAKGGRPRKAK